MSENGKKVALEVIDRLERGEKIVFKEILGNVGYSPAIQKNPKHITETKDYKETIAKVVEQMEERRQAAIMKLTDKKLDKASALQTATVMDILTKNIQLLGGKSTANVAINIQISDEIAEKNNLTPPK